MLAATEDSLLALTDHLPAEAAEALLELATGGTPQAASAPARHQPVRSPRRPAPLSRHDRRGELERALAYPWDKWTVFLHPAQRDWVERDDNGPARVSGSAGTGKTIVVAMACDDEVIPLQGRIDAVADAGDLEEVYATERHLLYVACTRARDTLWVSGVAPASEFLDDLNAA